MRRREFLSTVAAGMAVGVLPAVALAGKPRLTNKQIADIFERSCRGHLTNLLSRYGERINKTMFAREAEAIVDLEIGSLKRQRIETRVWFDACPHGLAIGVGVYSDERAVLWNHWNVSDTQKPKVFRERLIVALEPEEYASVMRSRFLA